MWNRRSERGMCCVGLVVVILGLGVRAELTIAQDIVGPVPIDRFLLSPGGVDVQSGHFDYSHKDLEIGSGPGGVELTRLEGEKRHRERLGQFSHNWEVYVTESAVTSSGLSPAGSGTQQISVNIGGWAKTFRTQSGVFGVELGPISPSSATLTRLQNGSTYFYKFTDDDGTIVTFSGMNSAQCSHTLSKCAYASTIEKPDGVRYQLSYDNLGATTSRLRTIASNTGWAIVFEYISSGGLPYISKACVLNLSAMTMPASPVCPAGVPTVTYQYSGNFLSKVVDVLGAEWNFTTTYTDAISDYDVSYYKPGYSTPYLVNTYHQTWDDTDLRVVSRQQFNPGPTYDYAYREISQGDFNPGGTQVAGGSYTSNGNTVSAHYGAYRPPKPPYNDRTWYVTPKPETLTDEIGRTYTANYCFSYPNGAGCRPMAMQWLRDPDGVTTYYTYDAYLNVRQMRVVAKAGSGLADVYLHATYTCPTPGNCAKPLTLTDARGNVTNYTYDPTHGGTLTEALPADASGVRPVKRYTYAQRYALVSNGVGGYVQAATPIWLVSEVRTCRTSATGGNACAGGASDEVVTSFDYGPTSGAPNNLQLRGQVVTTNGVSLRTCYSYDSNGRRISETKPNANLASCY